MALTERLAILIEANGAGAVREFQKVGDSAERELGRTENRTDKLGRTLTSVGAAAIGVGAVMVAGFAAAAKASESQTLANIKLENTLENMPKLAGETTEAFFDQAEALQKVTVAQDDEIISAQAMLGTFNLTKQEILDITPLVVDYARKFDTDLVSAATQVGKALDGNVGALKRNGVSIDEAMFKTDKYRAVQEALSRQVGGFAESEGKTFSGQLTIMQNQLGEIAEGVGVGAVDAFGKLLGPVVSLSDAFKGLSPEAQSTIGLIGTFGAVGLIAAGGISMTIGWLIKMRENFGVAKDAAEKLLESMRGMSVRSVAALGLLGVAAVAVAYNLKRAQDAGREMGQSFAASLGGDSAQRITALTSRINELDAELTAFSARSSTPEGWGIPAGLGDLLNDNANKTKAQKEELEGLRAELEKEKAASDAAAASTGLLGLEQQEAADSTLNHLDAAKQLNDQIRAAIDPLFGMVDALQKNKDAQDDLEQANFDVFAAQLDLNNAVKMFGEDSQPAIEAAATLKDKQDALNGANLNVAKSALDVTTAATTLKGAMDNGSVSVEGAKGMLAQWVTQGLLTEEAARKVAEKLFGVAVQAGTLDGKNIALSATADTSAAMFSLELLRQKTAEVFWYYGLANPGVVLYGRERETVYNNNRRAAGGPVNSGEAYLVGEMGPEVFVPNATGTIVPNHKLNSASTGAGMGGGEFHFYIDGKEIEVAMRRRELAKR